MINSGHTTKDLKNSIIKELYKFRNGPVAESLIKGGCPHKRVFGLLLPQIAQIANSLPKSTELAFDLWNDSDCREERILALYIFDPKSLDKKDVMKLINDIKSIEEADLLPFKILRNLPYASDFLQELTQSPDSSALRQHLLKMLRANLGLSS